MSRPLRWFSTENWDGTRWAFDASTHEISPELRGRPGTRGYNGVTLPDRRLVLVDAGSVRFVQDHTVLHEMMHVSVDGVEGMGPAEERVITEMAPRLWPILKRFGLRWPERPEGFDSLERRARRMSR